MALYKFDYYYYYYYYYYYLLVVLTVHGMSDLLSLCLPTFTLVNFHSVLSSRRGGRFRGRGAGDPSQPTEGPGERHELPCSAWGPRWSPGRKRILHILSITEHHNTIFLSRVSILLLTQQLFCPSVRPSVTRWYCTKTAQHIVIVFFHHTVAQSFQFYEHQTSSRNSDGVTPCGGAKYRWGIKIARFSPNKSLYLANDTKYCHGCYGRRIGNRTQAFEWHQIQ